MDIADLVSSKLFKSKQKALAISNGLLEKEISANELLEFARSANDVALGICLEAMEFATVKKTTACNLAFFQFASEMLGSTTSRIKWEAARVIGNTAHLFPAHLNKAIKHLLANSEHESTVVRWSAAYALGEILKNGSKHNKALENALESVLIKEEKNSIRKIYLAALKKTSPNK